MNTWNQYIFNSASNKVQQAHNDYISSIHSSSSWKPVPKFTWIKIPSASDLRMSISKLRKCGESTSRSLVCYFLSFHPELSDNWARDWEKALYGHSGTENDFLDCWARILESVGVSGDIKTSRIPKGRSDSVFIFSEIGECEFKLWALGECCCFMNFCLNFGPKGRINGHSKNIYRQWFGFEIFIAKKIFSRNS